jgi:hypothetical protein
MATTALATAGIILALELFSKPQRLPATLRAGKPCALNRESVLDSEESAYLSPTPSAS